MPTYNAMNYIVLDLEWNQSPKGKDGELSQIPFEIIEIGAIKLDESGNIIDSFNKLIKPVVYKELHHIIKDITGFTMKELNKGESFPTVAQAFINWCGDEYKFCTWGSLDITELFRNMRYHHIPLPKPPIFYFDLQRIFNIQFENGDRNTRSLEYAVDYLHIKTDEHFHRAYYDALYTAYVFQKLDIDLINKNYSIDYYQVPTTRSEEISVVYDTHSQFVSRSFDSKNDAMSDKNVTSTICYKCGKKAKKKIRWFSDNAKTYYSLSCCAEHGFLAGKIRIRRFSGEHYFVIKTLMQTNEEGVNKIKNRQLEIRAKRRKKRHT